MHRIFVYGTLKRGWPLSRLLDGQRFLGVAWTAPRYRMVNLGEYPGLIDATDGEGRSIEGELWEVDTRCLSALDEAEGVPEAEYERRPIVIKLDGCAGTGAHMQTVEAYFYLPPVNDLPDCGSVW